MRHYLPTRHGEVVQIGTLAEMAVVLSLEAARDHHLPWVEKMAADGPFHSYWTQNLTDLRWAIAEAEAKAVARAA